MKKINFIIILLSLTINCFAQTETQINDFQIEHSYENLEVISFSWATVQEQEKGRFRVEHSPDGEKWQILFTKRRKGNNSKYRKRIRANFMTNGNNYFRLVQT